MERKQSVKPMRSLLVILFCTVTAALYGALHDQITYQLAPEYYTKLKFIQFRALNFGQGTSWLVAAVGVAATWWVGAIGGLLIAIRCLPLVNDHGYWRSAALRVWVVVGVSALTAAAVGVYGRYIPVSADDLSRWQQSLQILRITDAAAFILVAHIHQASYAGGIAGLLLALLPRPRR